MNESEENIQYKDTLLQEQLAKLSLMDKSIKEQQLELKQKAVEVRPEIAIAPEVLIEVYRLVDIIITTKTPHAGNTARRVSQCHASFFYTVSVQIIYLMEII